MNNDCLIFSNSGNVSELTEGPLFPLPSKIIDCQGFLLVLSFLVMFFMLPSFLPHSELSLLIDN